MTGDELRQIRKDVLDRSQAQLAALLGVTPTAVARLEREERAIRGPLARLLRLLAAHPRLVKELEAMPPALTTAPAPRRKPSARTRQGG